MYDKIPDVFKVYCGMAKLLKSLASGILTLILLVSYAIWYVLGTKCLLYCMLFIIPLLVADKMMFLIASTMAKKKTQEVLKERQKKFILDVDIDNKIKESGFVALEYVSAFPTESAFEKVRTQNPDAYKEIKRYIDGKIDKAELNKQLEFQTDFVTGPMAKYNRKKAISGYNERYTFLATRRKVFVTINISSLVLCIICALLVKLFAVQNEALVLIYVCSVCAFLVTVPFSIVFIIKSFNVKRRIAQFENMYGKN